MCRMFAVRSAVPVKVEPGFRGLQRLAQEHHHGWGIVDFDGEAAWVEKSIDSAQACTRFDVLSKERSSRSLLAHIRLASVGAERHIANNHPFFLGGWAFMHNGTLTHFSVHRERFDQELAPRWREGIRGDTDSERCFRLFLTLIDGKSPAEVDTPHIARSLVKAMGIARAICDTPEGKPSSMNFVVSDGRRLVATRRLRTLSLARRDQVRFLASEGLWHGEQWEEIPEESVLIIDEQLEVQLSPLSGWEA